MRSCQASASILGKRQRAVPLTLYAFDGHFAVDAVTEYESTLKCIFSAAANSSDSSHLLARLGTVTVLDDVEGAGVRIHNVFNAAHWNIERFIFPNPSTIPS